MRISFRFNTLLLFSLVCQNAFSQESNKITSNDEIIIKRKAIGLVDNLANKYNQLLDADSEERNIIIENMILVNNDNTATFVDDQVYIEDDFNTRELKSDEVLTKKVDIYFKDMCFNYGREDNGTYTNEGKYVILSNVRTSKVMATTPNSQMFIKVFFDINYTGIDKRTSFPFKQPSNRVAEIKVEKVKNVWIASILTIRFLKTEESDLSKNVTVVQETLSLEARRTLLEIEDKVLSKVTIKSNVNAARVKIDGNQVGYLKNYKFEYFIKPGVYKFELSLEKYENSSVETVVKADSSITVTIPLRKLYSNVTFKVEPSDAVVLLNNQPIGNGNFTTLLPKGRHDIIIDKKGYKQDKSTIDIINDEATFQYQIYKITKSIEIVSNPAGASITNNQDSLGITPIKIDLPFGQHNLIFTKENYLPKQLLINVETSGIERFDVFLQEKPEFLLKKKVKTLRGKAIKRFIINGVFAGGSYYGYKYFDKQLKGLSSTKTDDKTLYNVGKYGSLGLGSIFAIASTVNLIKIFTVNKSKLLREQLEQKNSISFAPIFNGGVITFKKSF